MTNCPRWNHTTLYHCISRVWSVQGRPIFNHQ